MTSLSSRMAFSSGEAERGPVPIPAPHSQVAGSALQPTYELLGKGGTPQNQSRVVPDGARGRPAQPSHLSGGLGELALVGLAADGQRPEGAQELVGDSDVGLLFLERVVLAPGECQKAGFEVRVVTDQTDGSRVGEQAEHWPAAAMDAAGGLLLGGAALGGVAAGQLDHAAGVVQAAWIAAECEQVSEKDVAKAPDLAQQPAEAGLGKCGRHLGVEAADRQVAGLDSLTGHPGQEAAAVRAAELGAEPRLGHGRDLERRVAEPEHGLEVATGQVGEITKQLGPGQLEQRSLFLKRRALVDAVAVARLGEGAQLGPGAGLQLDLVEAQLAGQVGDEVGFALVGLVAGEVIELARPGDHEGLHGHVLKVEPLRVAGQDLPVMASGLHGQHHPLQAVVLAQPPGLGSQLEDAFGSGWDLEPVHPRLIGSAHEYDLTLALGDVDVGDQGMRVHDGRPARQFGGPPLHATSYLHCGPLRLRAGCASRIVEGLVGLRT